MITIIITLLVLLLGIFMLRSQNYEFPGVLLILTSGFWLAIHILMVNTQNLEYERFLVKRDSFEQTLKYVRENGNPYESAAIVKEIADYNIELAMTKRDNKKAFFGQYIDDRFESLTPIKQVAMIAFILTLIYILCILPMYFWTKVVLDKTKSRYNVSTADKIFILITILIPGVNLVTGIIFWTLEYPYAYRHKFKTFNKIFDIIFS